MAETKNVEMKDIPFKLRVAKVRKAFDEANVKKSGKNTYAKFKYYELADILPVCNRLCEKYGVLPVYSLGDTVAKLHVYDVFSDEAIVFSMTTAKADSEAQMGVDKQSRGMQPVQRLGSVTTYVKRYLYTNFLDLTENDSVDSKDPNAPQEEVKKDDKLLKLQTEFKKKCEEFGFDLMEVFKTHEITAQTSYDDLLVIYKKLFEDEQAK